MINPYLINLTLMTGSVWFLAAALNQGHPDADNIGGQYHHCFADFCLKFAAISIVLGVISILFNNYVFFYHAVFAGTIGFGLGMFNHMLG